MEGYVIVKRKKNEEVFHILIQKNSPIYTNMLYITVYIIFYHNDCVYIFLYMHKISEKYIK